MSKAKMRIGSILLVVAMLMTLLPVGVFAAGEIFEVNEQKYSDWKEAVAASEDGKYAIILTGDFTPQTEDLASLLTVKSDVIIQQGASLTLPNDSAGVEKWFGSTDSRMNITAGSITLSGLDQLAEGGCTWTLSDDAKVEIPADKIAYLHFYTAKGTKYGVNLVVPKGAELTVAGELKAISGTDGEGNAKPSTIDLAGTMNVTGTVSAAEKSTTAVAETGLLKIDTAGEVKVTGALEVTPNDDSNNIQLTSGAMLTVPQGVNLDVVTSKDGKAIVTYVDENGNTVVQNSGFTDAPEARIGDTLYESLDGQDGALDKATDNDTVILLKDATVEGTTTGNAINSGVTLIVPTGKTLTIGAAGFLGSQGVLQVNAGGSLQLPNSDGKMETFIGTDKEARFVLTAGSISMNINPGTLTLTENSEVTVPENKVAYLILGSNKANVTVETGSKITVAGTLNLATGNVVNVASGATMTVASTGIVEVHSTAQLKGDVNVAGKVYVFEGESASTAVNSAKLNLSAGGVVYAEKNALTADIVNAAYGILSQQEVEHSYTSVSATNEKPTTFKYQYSVIIPDDGGSTTTPTSYGITVSTAENGTVKSSNSSAAKDATVTITVTPGEGYVLDTLTVTDKDNNTVALTKVSDTQYTFKMPASAVTVKATFKKDEGTQPAALPFNDVSESEWFYEAVKYVYDKGMMNGVSDTSFAPYSNLTRGMIAQVLYNLEGKPAVSGSAYTDVAADQWYNDAVNWAAQKGIVTGYGDGTFGPMDNITREQMAAILYRYAQYKGYDVSAKGDLTAFTDGNTVSDWAKDAMSWAVGTALFNGKGDGILDPTTTATRAEVAKILMTYCENVAK